MPAIMNSITCWIIRNGNEMKLEQLQVACYCGKMLCPRGYIPINNGRSNPDTGDHIL